MLFRRDKSLCNLCETSRFGGTSPVLLCEIQQRELPSFLIARSYTENTQRDTEK
jgi:hypothetical protein